MELRFLAGLVTLVLGGLLALAAGVVSALQTLMEGRI